MTHSQSCKGNLYTLFPFIYLQQTHSMGLLRMCLKTDDSLNSARKNKIIANRNLYNRVHLPTYPLTRFDRLAVV